MTLTYPQEYLYLKTQCKYMKHMTFWVPCWHTYDLLLIWHHTWPPGSLVGTSTYGENSLIFHTHWIACQLRCTHCPHTSIWVTIRGTGFPALPTRIVTALLLCFRINVCRQAPCLYIYIYIYMYIYMCVCVCYISLLQQIGNFMS